MANLAVAVKMKIKLPSGDRIYASPVEYDNGRLKRFYALVKVDDDFKEQYHPEAVYTLVYRENGKLRTKAIGSGLDEIATAKAAQESKLKAIAHGHIKTDVVKVDNRRLVKDAIEKYLGEQESKASGTHNAYRITLAEFTQVCKKKYLEQIDREDWLAFIKFLKGQGYSDRTVSNRVASLKTFFINFGLPIPLQKNDKALYKYTEKKAKAYNKKDLAALFANLSVDQKDLFQTFLCTGARDEELQFAIYSDFDETARSFAVTAKPALGFRPKDCEERIIPIPQSLVDLLAARHKRYPNRRLIFPAARGGADTHFIRIIKKVAFANGLNCGDCITPMKKRKNGQITGGLSCKGHPVCEKWQLHRFRKTYATMSHHDGTPVRTIQKRLGHADLDTTLLYLADVEDDGEETRTILENTFAFLDGSNSDRQERIPAPSPMSMSAPGRT
jgi:integrase/recombinase XerD